MGCTQTKSKVKDYTVYLEYFSKRSGQGKYLLKPLTDSDLKHDGYLNLIKQFDKENLNGLDDAKIREQTMSVLNDDSYYILTWILPSSQNYIVATATLNFQKSVGERFSKTAHVSHLIVDKNHRGKALGKTLKEVLTLIAFREENVFKVIDDSQYIGNKSSPKTIKKELFESSFSDVNVKEEPREIRFLDHKSSVISLISFTKFDEFKQGEKEFLLSCSIDCTVKIWDLELETCVKTLELGHTKTVTSLLYMKHSENDFLFTASKDNTIRLIGLKDGELITKFLGHQESVNCLLRLKDQIFDFKGFLSCSDDGYIKIWSMESSDSVFDLNLEKPIKCVIGLEDFDENVNFAIISGLNTGTILIHDIKTQKLLNSLQHSNINAVTCLCNFQKKDEKILLSGCADGTVKVWNCVNGSLLKNYQENTIPITCLKLALFEGNAIFATGSTEFESGEIRFWSLEQDQSFKKLPNFGYGVSSLCYLAKYQFLVVSWSNGFRVLKLK